MAQDKQEQSDPGFRIVDKRQGAASEETKQGPAEPSAPGEGGPAAVGQPSAAASGAEQPAAEEAPELEVIDVYGVVQYCISLLSGHAWQWMGLVMNPVTRRAERDLAQARIAIDCVEALFKQVEPSMPEAAARSIRQALSDLRVNFVQQSAQGS